MFEKMKRYLAAIAAVLGIAAGYGLGSADAIGKATAVVKAATAAVEVLDQAASEAPAADAEVPQ